MSTSFRLERALDLQELNPEQDIDVSNVSPPRLFLSALSECVNVDLKLQDQGDLPDRDIESEDEDRSDIGPPSDGHNLSEDVESCESDADTVDERGPALTSG